MAKLSIHHRTNRLDGLTVFAPLPAAAHSDLKGRLRALRLAGSPFESVPGTHFARLALLGPDQFRPQKKARGMRPSARLLDLVTHLGRRQREDRPTGSYLLFNATYDGGDGGDGGRAGYVEALRQNLGETADLIWGLCTGYPGRDDPAAFLAFFTERSLPSRYMFTASKRQPRVEELRSALELRRQVIDLAVETDGLPDEELVRRVRQVFG